MRVSRSFRLSALALVSLFTLTGFGCRQAVVAPKKPSQPLVMWGLWQDTSDLDPVIQAFKKQTGIDVQYKKLASVAGYQQQLLDALAQGRGPDIFVIHHTWVESQQGIMAPAPATVIDPKAVNDEFVDVVSKDLVRNGHVYALPVSVDSLALYYNKDLLSAAGIARPPQTWDEVQQDVQKLTSLNRDGTIQQSGIAMGTAANVNRPGDIVQALMLQNGLAINDPSTNAGVSIANDNGSNALTFYTDFANKAKNVFTWDLQQDYSVDAFSEGKSAMMISYSYQLAAVRAKNPRLNFAVAPLPQIPDSTKKVTLAAYWPFAVAKASPAADAAWQFVRFLSDKDNSIAVNKSQDAPPARRDAVLQLERDQDIGVFAQGALTADSWPRPDITVSDKIFNDMIDGVVTGQNTVTDALKRAEDQLNQSFNPNGPPATSP